MIRVFLLLLTALAASWFVADTLKQKGSGYAYIYFNHYSIETSFWALMLAILGVVATLYFLLRFGGYAIRLAIKTAVLPKKIGVNKSRKLNQTALLAYLEGNWLKADGDMAKALKKVENPFIANLLILQTQLKRGDISAAETTYKQAQTCADYDELSLMLAYIDILLAKKAFKEAHQYCHNLLREYPFEERVVLKTLKLHQLQDDPVAMEPLIKSAKKHKLLSADEQRQWQCDYYLQHIARLHQLQDFAGLKKLWRKAYKLHDETVDLAYFNAAAELAEPEEREKMLRQQLRKHFTDDLCVLYASTDMIDHHRQLEFLQSLLTSHADSAGLLAALAVMYKKTGQFDKALQSIEESLSQKASSLSYQIQADIHAASGESSKQLESLQKALAV